MREEGKKLDRKTRRSHCAAPTFPSALGYGPHKSDAPCRRSSPSSIPFPLLLVAFSPTAFSPSPLPLANTAFYITEQISGNIETLSLLLLALCIHFATIVEEEYWKVHAFVRGHALFISSRFLVTTRICFECKWKLIPGRRIDIGTRRCSALAGGESKTRSTIRMKHVTCIGHHPTWQQCSRRFLVSCNCATRSGSF